MDDNNANKNQYVINTSMEDINKFMEKYTTKYPELGHEAIWQLFFIHKGNYKAIDSHISDMYKVAKKSKRARPRADWMRLLKDTLKSRKNKGTENEPLIKLDEDVDDTEWEKI